MWRPTGSSPPSGAIPTILGHKVGDRVLITVSPEYSYYVVIKGLQKTGESDEDRLKQY